jgi:hypothetical protein
LLPLFFMEEFTKPSSIKFFFFLNLNKLF